MQQTPITVLHESIMETTLTMMFPLVLATTVAVSAQARMLDAMFFPESFPPFEPSQSTLPYA